jgi:hypothetical protein
MSYIRTFSELTALITSLRKRQLIEHGHNHTTNEVINLQDQLQVNFPEEYRQFLSHYGWIAGEDLAVFGLPNNDSAGFNVMIATITLRLAVPQIPLEIIPIMELENESYACLVCMQADFKNGFVVLMDGKNCSLTEMPVIETCLNNFLFNQLQKLEKSADVDASSKVLEEAWGVFERHVTEYQKKFEYDHATGGKLPRNTDWRPYRYCVQDVVFGVTVLRQLQEGNCLQVDVFLTAEIKEYGPLAGARALISFLLSEAFKCGGSMEIRFTKNVEQGRIPVELQQLAKQHAITFSLPDRILALEAKLLYSAITGFSDFLERRIQEMEANGQISMARACYVVNHGVWSKSQLEMIVLGSDMPESIISGSARPEQRHLYYHDLLHARSALLADMLERILIKRENTTEEGVEFELEDDRFNLVIQFSGSDGVKTYHCSDPLSLPWLLGSAEQKILVENIPFQVLIRCRDTADLRLHFGEDVHLANKLHSQNKFPTFILVPADFLDLPKDLVDSNMAMAQEMKISILVCPERTINLDLDAAQRLSKSRILRQ